MPAPRELDLWLPRTAGWEGLSSVLLTVHIEQVPHLLTLTRVSVDKRRRVDLSTAHDEHPWPMLHVADVLDPQPIRLGDAYWVVTLLPKEHP